MTRERKTSSTKSAKNALTMREYDIAGNRMRAYFDAKNTLVFVVDETINDVKPNVLLVVSPDGTRKWDDILANDYGVDLETIRPRRDNKYQKLDIEYSGLGVYDALIDAYNDNDGVDDAIAALNAYRDVAAQNAAAARMTSADAAADRARTTIEKTNATITELNSRIRGLRTQLSQQRREIGREPTKHSASKILRTESQIDAATEKLARAKRRLATAKRRLAAAANDSDTAREILGRPRAVSDMRDKNMAIADMRRDAAPANIAAPINTDIATRRDAPVPASTTQQPQVDNMADTDVKPLFEQNPNIMDSDIAFKPIDFDIPVPATNKESPAPAAIAPADNDVPDFMPVPLSFDADADNDDNAPAPVSTVDSAPVLDSMRPVVADDAPDDVADAEPEMPAPILPTPIVGHDTHEYSRDDEPDTMPVTAPADSMPEISVASNASGFRPVSPLTGDTPVDTTPRRPTLIYYVMLIVLIALSIFTLWLYQRGGQNTTPNLVATGKTSAAIEQPTQMPTPAPVDVIDDIDDDSPFITGDADSEFIPAPAMDNDVAPVTADIAPAVIVESAPEPMPAPVGTSIISDIDVVDTDTDVEPINVEPESVAVSDIDDTPITPEKPAYNVAPSASVVAYDGPMCDDGTAPDANGCCGAEEYSQMADGSYACCLADECFPPMF